jgi:hypothetical protein
VLMIVVVVTSFGAGLWLVTRPEQRLAPPAVAEVPDQLVSVAAEGVVFERA